jgi:hypothetical protein
VAEQAWASGEEASLEDAIADAVAMLEVGAPQPSLHPA